MFQKKERYCCNCGFSRYVKGQSIMACGYICKINPFRPVVMGIMGECSERKRNKMEQYSEKDS